jgi:hypothetical protein
VVAEIANASVSVLRGTTVDQFGDIRDASVPVLTGVPACLIETTQQVMDPATQTPRTVRASVCTVSAYAGVLNSDQIVNERDGSKYIVESVESVPSLTGAPADTKLVLRRISGTGL